MVPPESHTPGRLIRAEQNVWDTFGEACGMAGKDRSAVTRDFWRWYARLPGAKLPRRPPAAHDPAHE